MDSETTTSATIPAPRLDFAAAAPTPFAAMLRLERSIEIDSPRARSSTTASGRRWR